MQINSITLVQSICSVVKTSNLQPGVCQGVLLMPKPNNATGEADETF